MEPIYISTHADLKQVAVSCVDVSVVSLDTEFARFNTYYPMVGLVQLATDQHCFLIDPVAISNFEPLTEILTRPDLLKVVHAGSEDMEVFQYSLGVTPTPVFDTQIAAAVLGVGFSMSYQKLVAHYLNIDVPKEETRSDWLRRPLSASQLQYAALDVVYLYQVYFDQLSLLQALDRENWVLEESAKLNELLPTAVDPADSYLKGKGLHVLNRRQLGCLQLLYAWRERLARSKNIPRNRIIDPKQLLCIVRLGLDSIQKLRAQSDLSSSQLRRYGAQILEVVQQSKNRMESDLPRSLQADSEPIDKKKLMLLKKTVDNRASELGISPELLSRRRDLESLLRTARRGAAELPEFMKGWREEVIGRTLLDAVR